MARGVQGAVKTRDEEAMVCKGVDVSSCQR